MDLILEEPRYSIQFDFETEGDPPGVHIWDSKGDWDIIEVYEEPILLNPTGWSWDENDWKAGPLATALLQLMNERADKLPEAGEPSGDF